MLQAFIVVFREGFESFLIVGVILAYLRRIGEHRLVPAMYWGIGASLLASAGLGYMLNRGVNEALWEGLFGIATIILVGSLVVHMWKAGAQMKSNMEAKLSRISSRSSATRSRFRVPHRSGTAGTTRSACFRSRPTTPSGSWT